MSLKTQCSYFIFVSFKLRPIPDSDVEGLTRHDSLDGVSPQLIELDSKQLRGPAAASMRP